MALSLKLVFADALKDVETGTIKSHLKDDEQKGLIKIQKIYKKEFAPRQSKLSILVLQTSERLSVGLSNSYMSSPLFPPLPVSGFGAGFVPFFGLAVVCS